MVAAGIRDIRVAYAGVTARVAARRRRPTPSARMITFGVADPPISICLPSTWALIIRSVVAAAVAAVTLITVSWIITRLCVAASKKAAARLGMGEKDRRGGQTDQPSLQLEASRRRSRAPSTSPVITDSCDERGESCAVSADGNPQPLALESNIARWTSIACRGPCIDLVNAL